MSSTYSITSTMHHLLLIFAAGALLATGGARAANLRGLKKRPVVLSLDVDNDIENKVPQNTSRKFARILPPPKLHHTGGEHAELRCEGMGKPAPHIQWLRNNLPMLEHETSTPAKYHPSPRSSFAIVSSTILLPPSSNSEDIYTCIVRADDRSTSASTTVYAPANNADLSERHRLYPLSPRILVSYSTYWGTQGESAVIPCRAKGHPRPRYSWQDEGGVDVRSDPRMKVLRTGELVISRLLWSDMGNFTCTAANRFGSEAATTWIYPLTP